MKRFSYLALALGACLVFSSELRLHAKAAVEFRLDDPTTRNKHNRFFVPTMTNPEWGKDMCNSLPKQYAGKIKSCVYDPVALALDITYDVALPEIEILQILRINGFQAWFIEGDNMRISLDASGENAVSEQIKH